MFSEIYPTLGGLFMHEEIFPMQYESISQFSGSFNDISILLGSLKHTLFSDNHETGTQEV